MFFQNSKVNLGLTICLPFLILFALEAVYRENLLSMLTWITNYPKQFFLSYILMFGLINIFYILPRRIYIAIGVLLLSLFSVIGFVSSQKLVLRGEPLLPWDFILGKEALNIFIQFSAITHTIPFIGISIITIIFLFSIRFISKEEFNWRKKITVMMISFVVLFSFYIEFISLKNSFSLQLINWSQKLNYDENGMLLGFLLNTQYLFIDEPSDYNRETIQQIVEEIKPAYTIEPDFQPNIIFLMSEAFWDPTLLKEVSFSEDPISYFHSLQKNHTSGIMLSPVFGGGTANTEFEVLTGFSTQLLPQGMIPYIQYVHNPIEALPTVLKKQGYETTAIHTYDNWFYRRNNVYQNFGFDKFISKEFFNEPEYNGQYIRDTELSKRILEEMKKTNKPDFIFAVSMQAHGPYSAEKNPDNLIKITSNLSPESKAILENYANIVYDVDQSLKLLIEGLEQLKEPSLVVFWGDHLPMLGTSCNIYQEAGFFHNESDYSDYLNKYSVPFIVWDNFSNSKEVLRLSSNFLSAYILESAKKEGSPLTDFLYTLAQNGSRVVINEHHLPSETISQKEINEYRLLQYDFLFGNKYVYMLKPDNNPQANPDYVLGDGRTLIVNATPPNALIIEIQGENFLQNNTVYINGQSVKTDFKNPTYLTANIPKRLNRKSGTLEIQVKLKDSMGSIISESNTFKLEIS